MGIFFSHGKLKECVCEHAIQARGVRNYTTKVGVSIAVSLQHLFSEHIPIANQYMTEERHSIGHRA